MPNHELEIAELEDETEETGSVKTSSSIPFMIDIQEQFQIEVVNLEEEPKAEVVHNSQLSDLSPHTSCFQRISGSFATVR